LFDTNQLSVAIYSLPLITALIGWVTNYIAIKMLFHPRKAIKLLFFELQGILPRRQGDIAVQLGRIVATDLLSSDDLAKQLTSRQSREIFEAYVDEQSEIFIREKLRRAGIVSRLLMRSQTLARIKISFTEELMEQLPTLIDKLCAKDNGALDVQQLVEDKVREFSSDRLEKIFYDILAKEFRFIEVLGAILGFIIGSLQLISILLLS